jgi:hypothetical protein
MNWKIGNNGQAYPILIDWLMFCSLSFPWQIFNTYLGRERNSLIYKYYIEIQILLFSPHSSLSRECQYLPSLKVLGKDCRLRTGNRHMSSLCQYIVGLHDKIFCIKMFWFLQTFLTMMAAMLKFMFIYNQFMMLDDTSFRKCVCGVTSLFNKIKH